MGFLQSLFQRGTANIHQFHPHMVAGSERDSYNNQPISTLLACQKILSEQLAKLPLEVYHNTAEAGRIKHKQHKLYKLLHTSPNNYQTSYTFIQQLVLWMLEYGNSYARIITAKGEVTGFELIHPTEIRGYKIKNGNLMFYRVGEGCKEGETIHNDELLHLKFISRDGIMGVNPIVVLYTELNNIYQGKTTLNATYQNNLNVDKYISSDSANFASKNIKEAIESIKSEYAGAANTRKVPVLPAGFKLLTVPSGNIQDAQILESLNFAKRDIAALYGIPVHLLNFEGGSYNSIEQNTLNFKTNTLQPLARQFKQEFEKKLLSDEDIDAGVSIEFNLNALVETDLTTRINYLKTLHGMAVITSNDVAKMEGFETYRGGENHYLQMQYVAIEHQQQEVIEPVVQDKKEENE